MESQLIVQLEKSEAMEQSLKELKTDNEFLQQQKTELWDDVKVKEDEIATLKEQATSLKKACHALSQGKQNEIKASYIEMDNLKSQLLTKEEELAFVKRKSENEYQELAKCHGLFLGQILAEAQEINLKLFTASRNYAESRPEIHKTTSVLLLLKQLKQDIEALSDKSSALEITVKQLRNDIENQSTTLEKVSNDKKLLKDEIAEVNQQNKALVKDKAKLERDNESLRKEAVRIKNTSQTFKVRLEELKANVRSAKRENETVLREKQNIEMVLKGLGIDYKSLFSQTEGKRNNDAAQSNKLQNLKTNSPTNGLNAITEAPIIKAEMKDASTLTRGIEELKQRSKAEIQKSGLVKECNASVHSKLRCETSEQSSKLKEIFARITTDKDFCLKMIFAFLDHGNVYAEQLAQKLFTKCDCYEDQVIQLQVLESIKLKLQMDNRTVESLRKEVEELKGENLLLKSERAKQGKSLEHYKELVRGYSRVANREHVVERDVGAREMRLINRELERYGTLLERQEEGLGTKLVGVNEGINLIHAMYQQLKRFAGKLMRNDTSRYTAKNRMIHHCSLNSGGLKCS